MPVEVSRQRFRGLGVATDVRGRTGQSFDAGREADSTSCWSGMLEGAAYPCALWSGSELRFRWANRRFLEMLWESEARFDVLGMPVRGFLSDAGIAVRFQDAAYTGEPYTDPGYAYLSPHNEQTYWRLNLLPITARLGDPYDVLFTAVDVTAEHLAEEAATKKRADLAAAEGLIQRTILSTLDADEILQRALVESTEAYGADWGWIALRELDSWVFRNVHGWPADSVGRSFRDDEASLPRLAAEAGEVVVAPSPGSASSRARGLMASYDIGAFVLVPLYARGEIKGVMGFCWNDPEPLGAAHKDLGEKLSLSVTLGLENARTYGTERQVARTLQSAFFTLPNSVPGIEFAHLYHSAAGGARVGGDFYDLVQAGGGRVGIAIGDVTGEGIGASALASLVRSSVHVHALEAGKPGKVLDATNNVLMRSMEGTVASVFFGMLDVNDGRFAYCSAGHPRPIILPVEGEPRLLEAPQLLLGAQAEAAYSDKLAQVGVGDLLLLYTDGLTQVCDRDGEPFGEQRLLASVRQTADLPMSQVPESVFLDALSFAEGRVSDDIALLALRRTSLTPEQQMALSA